MLQVSQIGSELKDAHRAFRFDVEHYEREAEYDFKVKLSEFKRDFGK